MSTERPTGTVTFLFTDIEGSTRLLRELGERYEAMRLEHDRMLRDAAASRGGEEVDTQGDSFLFSFRRAKDAVAAAADAQRALQVHQWPEGSPLRVRMGLHSGEPDVGVDGRYIGLTLHRAARISAAARGGQVLVSQATVELVPESLPPGVSLRKLGRHAFKDFDRTEPVSQLVIDGLPSEFPRVRTEGDRHRRRRILIALGALVLAGGIAGAVAAVTGGSGAKSVPVAANSVAVIDPGTNRVSADLPVGRYPSVVAGAGRVWAANRDDGTISQIDPKTDEVRTLSFANAVTGIAAGLGRAWAADPDAGTIAPIEPGASRPGEAIRVSTRVTTHGFDRAGAPGAIAVAFGSVWVWINIPVSELVRVNPATGSIVKKFNDVTLGEFTINGQFEGAAGITRGKGHLWAASPGDGSALEIDPRLNAVLRHVPVPYTATDPFHGDEPSAIAVGLGAVWVTLPAADTLWRLDPITGQTQTIPVGRRPTGIAVGAGSVWVANEFAGTVSKIDPKTNTVVATIPVGHSPGSVAFGYGRVWVGVRT